MYSSYHLLLLLKPFFFFWFQQNVKQIRLWCEQGQLDWKFTRQNKEHSMWRKFGKNRDLQKWYNKTWGKKNSLFLEKNYQWMKKSILMNVNLFILELSNEQFQNYRLSVNNNKKPVHLNLVVPNRAVLTHRQGRHLPRAPNF